MFFMNNLFSSFDMLLLGNDMYLYMFILVVFNNMSNKMILMMKSFIFKSIMEMIYIMNPIKWEMGKMFVLPLIMMLIFIMNFLSVNSYNFPLTSQASITFSISFMLWMSIVMFLMSYKKNYLLIHLIPEGSPMGLMPFLYLIETISLSIRPLTLFIRLMSNIMAGHILMVLLSKMVISTTFFMFIMYFFLTMIEMMVSIIQSYIFMCLLSLYQSE